MKSVVKRKSVYRSLKEPILSSDTLSGMKAQWTSHIACFCSTGEQLHVWQIRWAADQAASLQQHLRKANPHAVIDGEWPLIPLTPERNHPKIKVQSVAPLLGEAIKRIHREESVSELF